MNKQGQLVTLLAEQIASAKRRVEKLNDILDSLNKTLLYIPCEISAKTIVPKRKRTKFSKSKRIPEYEKYETFALEWYEKHRRVNKFLFGASAKRNISASSIEIVESIKSLRRLEAKDGFNWDAQIVPVLFWAITDKFWKGNLRSLRTTRKINKDGHSKFENILAAYSMSVPAGSSLGDKIDPPYESLIKLFRSSARGELLSMIDVCSGAMKSWKKKHPDVVSLTKCEKMFVDFVTSKCVKFESINLNYAPKTFLVGTNQWHEFEKLSSNYWGIKFA
jgi:hypothetical protein